MTRPSTPAVEKELTDLCAFLLRRRNELGLSLASAARSAGMSPAGLNRLERGERSPTVRSLVLLTRAYGITLMVGNGQVREQT